MTVQVHDKKTPYEDVDVIDIPFPDEKYTEILHSCNLDKDSELGDSQMSQILVNATYQWLLGKWSIDDLSCIGNKFWFERESKFDDLGNALYDVGECAFSIIQGKRMPNISFGRVTYKCSNTDSHAHQCRAATVSSAAS